jgi:hypothetical protein
MSLPPMECKRIDVLKTYLSGFLHVQEAKPNGQCMYTFPDGLVLNVYETTGKVVFQGSNANGQLAQQIAIMITQINTPIPTAPMRS